MDLNVQVSEELVIGVELPPGAPRPTGMALDFEAHDEEELRELVEKLGGLDAFYFDPSRNLSPRYSVPVTCDGEVVMTATLHLWFRDGEPLVKVKHPAIKRLSDEQKARRDAEHV